MDNVEVNFQTLVEFTKLSDEKREKAIPWREVLVNKVFQITNHRNVNKAGGNFNIKGEDRNIQDVWASSLIAKKIQKGKDYWVGKQLFIISKGKKVSKKQRNLERKLNIM